MVMNWFLGPPLKGLFLSEAGISVVHDNTGHSFWTRKLLISTSQEWRFLIILTRDWANPVSVWCSDTNIMSGSEVSDLT